MNESDLILDPEVKQRLEQVLGIEVPDPNSLEFQTLLEELQETQPDLFEEVMRGLTVNVEFPAEQQASKVARRESFSALVNRLIFRRSAVDGTPVAAKRRWLMYVFVAAGLLGPGLYILGQTFSRNDTAPEEIDTLAQVAPVQPVQPETQLSREAEPDPEPEITPPPPAPVPVQAKEPAPAPPRTTTPPPPRPVTPAAPAPAAPAPTAPAQPKEVPVVRPATMTLYQNETPRPAQMSLFSSESTEAEELPGLTLYTDESGSDTLLVSNIQDTTPSTLTIPVGENPNTTERPTQLQIGQPESEEAEQSLAQGGMPVGNAPQPQTEMGGAVQPGQVQAGMPVEGGAVQAPDKLLETILQPGARIGAVLETGIVLTPGASVPVVARSDSEWCTAPPCPEITWIGQAMLDASNRVQINFTEAVFGDAAQTITGMALGAGNTPGLGAAVKDTAPTVAQDLVRSAAGGFADYVGVLSQQQKVSFVNGMPITETQTPPLDLFILGKMGSVFDLPENATPIVRISEVPAGSQIIVLFGLSSFGGQAVEQ